MLVAAVAVCAFRGPSGDSEGCRLGFSPGSGDQTESGFYPHNGPTSLSPCDRLGQGAFLFPAQSPNRTRTRPALTRADSIPFGGWAARSSPPSRVTRPEPGSTPELCNGLACPSSAPIWDPRGLGPVVCGRPEPEKDGWQPGGRAGRQADRQTDRLSVTRQAQAHAP